VPHRPAHRVVDDQHVSARERGEPPDEARGVLDVVQRAVGDDQVEPAFEAQKGHILADRPHTPPCGPGQELPVQVEAPGLGEAEQGAHRGRDSAVSAADVHQVPGTDAARVQERLEPPEFGADVLEVTVPPCQRVEDLIEHAHLACFIHLGMRQARAERLTGSDGAGTEAAGARQGGATTGTPWPNVTQL